MQNDLLAVLCVHCTHWFDSNVPFDSIDKFLDSLEAVQHNGNVVHCEHCGRLTPFTNANIRIPDLVELIDDTVRVA